MQLLAPALVNHTTTNATTINEDAVRAPKQPSVKDPIRKFSSADAVIDATHDVAGITTFAREYNTVVSTKPSNVDTESERSSRVDKDFALIGHSLVDVRCDEELHKALTGELTEDADADVVGVGAIGFDELVLVDAVGDGDSA